MELSVQDCDSIISRQATGRDCRPRDLRWTLVATLSTLNGAERDDGFVPKCGRRDSEALLSY
jgi:hypothetical protein